MKSPEKKYQTKSDETRSAQKSLNSNNENTNNTTRSNVSGQISSKVVSHLPSKSPAPKPHHQHTNDKPEAARFSPTSKNQPQVGLIQILNEVRYCKFNNSFYSFILFNS